jgi:glycerophosphoryl diester phosphodiesterase
MSDSAWPALPFEECRMRRLLLLVSFLAACAGAAPLAVHGHRGAPVARPENTIPSFLEAIRAGADFVELDLAVTRDNVLVVSHDQVINLEICEGPGGKRPIREMTLEEVRRYDCGSLKPKAFPNQQAQPGARIPTFDEVLDLAKSSSIRFNIEVKSSPKTQQYTPAPEEFSRMVAGAVREHGLQKRVIVQSFDWRIVKALRAVAPELTVAALYGTGDRSYVDIARETGAQLVTPHFGAVTPEKVKAAHEAGIPIIPWTADQSADWSRLIAAGVDGIITNDPGALVAYLKERGLR